METRVKRYSRILVSLPPVLSVKEKVRGLVEETFKFTPEYVETPWFEGYAVSWRSWCGFEDCLKYPSCRSFFPLQIKNIISEWLDDEEDILVVEYTDEDRWDWLDVRKNYLEIFHNEYNYSYCYTVRVYSDYLQVKSYRENKKEIAEIAMCDWLELGRLVEIYPVFKVLARRGYWNINGIIVSTARDKFYEKIGFTFE